jgi:GxxExxY protein
MELGALTDRVIGCAIEVHRFLGPGLLESAYSHCFAYELTRAGIGFEREKPVGIAYRGVDIDCGFRVDMLIEDCLLIELKAIDKLQPIHRAQLLTYMKMTNKGVGLLINFNCRVLKDGLVRLVL